MKLKTGKDYTLKIEKEIIHAKLSSIDNKEHMLFFDVSDNEYSSSDIIIDFDPPLEKLDFYTGNDIKVVIKEGKHGKVTEKQFIKPTKKTKKTYVKKTTKKIDDEDIPMKNKRISKKVKRSTKKRSTKKRSTKKRSTKKSSNKREVLKIEVQRNINFQRNVFYIQEHIFL